jgi:hypothetical protein
MRYLPLTDTDRRVMLDRIGAASIDDLFRSFCGAGAYRHHVPASVDHLIQRSEFLTTYTPYQPEIAQGTLQYLFEFQTQVAPLPGWKSPTPRCTTARPPAAEAVADGRRVTKRKRVVMSGGCTRIMPTPSRRCAKRTGDRHRGSCRGWRARSLSMMAAIDDGPPASSSRRRLLRRRDRSAPRSVRRPRQGRAAGRRGDGDRLAGR